MGCDHSDRELVFLVQSRRSTRLVGIATADLLSIFYIILCLDVAKRFGKGGGFAVGLILLPFIFFPILGFGSAQYQGAPMAA